MAETGKIKMIHDSGRYGFITPDQGREDVFFQVRWVQNAPSGGLSVGMSLEYETRRTEKGLQTSTVRYVGAGAGSASRSRSRTRPSQQAGEYPHGYRFLNPYNFVRPLPPRPDSNLPAAQLLGRMAPPTHDRWIGLSGEIACEMETVTPLFVSDSEQVDVVERQGKKEHRSYQFFRIGDQKAVPATTLRGVFRSVYEAVTNSSFSHFGGEQLSYRLDSRDVQKLIPGRVLRQEQQRDGETVVTWSLQLLPGKRLPGKPAFDPDVGQKNGLYAAPVRFYEAVRPTGKRRNNPPPPVVIDPDQWKHKSEYYAVMREMQFPPSYRVVALAESEEGAQRELNRIRGQFRPGTTLLIQRGWLCKTLQNADNKNSERFFFRDADRTDVPEMLPLPKRVKDNYEALIQDYRRRHAADVAKRDEPRKVERGPKGPEIAFSRFVQKENKEEERLQDGDLVYAFVRYDNSGRLAVKYLAPVSWPRVAYDRSIADLLPKHLHHCDSYNALCPACRLFGWVHGEDEQSATVSNPIAYASRVRFTHALMTESGAEMPEETLAILGAPKPTTTRFYLAASNGKPSSRPRRDNEVGYDGNRGKNKLRGRKFYRHFMPSDRFRLGDERSDQNRTIRDAEGAGARFSFIISFENLAPVELGALLWSLSLGGKGYHRVGYGKPLGMGSVAVHVGAVRLNDWIARYQQVGTEWQQPLDNDGQQRLIAQFQEMLVRPYAADEVVAYAEENGSAAWHALFEQLPNVQDLLAILSQEEPDLPVHYPFSPERNAKGSFEWFVGNNRLNGPRKELDLAVDDEGLPLITRKGQIW